MASAGPPRTLCTQSSFGIAGTCTRPRLPTGSKRARTTRAGKRCYEPSRAGTLLSERRDSARVGKASRCGSVSADAARRPGACSGARRVLREGLPGGRGTTEYEHCLSMPSTRALGRMAAPNLAWNGQRAMASPPCHDMMSLHPGPADRPPLRSWSVGALHHLCTPPSAALPSTTRRRI
jgi:hypothetical protein